MEKSLKRDTVNVNFYVVAFVDILGQRSLLRDLKTLPQHTGKDLEKFTDLLRQTAGTVEGLRTLFQSYFQANRRTADYEMFLPGIASNKIKLQSNPLVFKMFSDFVAIYLSLQDDVNILPMSGVYSVIVSAASICLLSLAAQKPIRGGIDIGIGLELDNNDIYGSALSRAYEIESYIAKYPRIVIGDELIRYLKAQSGQEITTPMNDISKKLSDLCLSFIKVDHDGYPFLDYLGNAYKDNIASQLDKEVIHKAYRYVIKKWWEFRNEKKSELAFRYMLLRVYFQSNLHIWFDNPDDVISSTVQECCI